MFQSFSEKLAASGFQHRATPLGRRVVYRLADKSAYVSVDADEWRALCASFSARVAPVRRRMNWMYLSLPPGIMLYALTLGQVIPGVGVIILLAIFGGPPAIYLWQSREVERIARSIEAELARRPRVMAPPEDPGKPPRLLDIACLYLIGPGLILSVIGEIGGPDTFRGTPLTGTHFGPLAWAASAVIALRLFWWVRGRLAD